jgi:hypothetical protein
VFAASWLFFVIGELAAQALYRRLFGILHRNISQEYAEPVSFWVTLALYIGIGITMYVIGLALL